MSIDRSAYVEVLSNLYKRDGFVKASVLVEESKPKDAPLHDAFEWNDKKAGKEYRLWQARKIIRTTKIILDEKEEILVNVPVIKTKEEGEYKPASVVVQKLDEYTLALEKAIDMLNAARKRVEELEVAAGKAEQHETLAKVTVALKALETANNALTMH